MRRLHKTRFSKKTNQFRAIVSIHYMYSNLVRHTWAFQHNPARNINSTYVDILDGGRPLAARAEAGCIACGRQKGGAVAWAPIRSVHRTGINASCLCFCLTETIAYIYIH